MTEEGGICPCGGIYIYVPDGDCACHISPPCDACTNSYLECNLCHAWPED